MATDYVINVNLRFEQFARAMGIYSAKKSFMTMDNISIMCRNLCLSLLNMNHISSTDFLYLLLLTVVNMYKHG